MQNRRDMETRCAAVLYFVDHNSSIVCRDGVYETTEIDCAVLEEDLEVIG